MGYIQSQTQALEAYLPPLTKEADFDVFWEETLRITRENPLKPTREETACPLGNTRVYDISYNGFDDTPIHGWLLLPAADSGKPLPCLIRYHGFSGNRGFPWDFSHWILSGMAVLSIDCREQGGLTGNRADYSGGMSTSVACKGIQFKEEYYYRAVYMDCLRAIDFALTCAEVDPARIVLEGGSQGGALGMAVAALDDRPAAALVDVPSSSNLSERVINGYGSYLAVRNYLKIYPDQTDAALRTLSYFDTMNMAERITCPVLASVALLDDVCPAKCYFATYNRILAKKRVIVYPFNGHEGGGSRQTGEKLAFLKELGFI